VSKLIHEEIHFYVFRLLEISGNNEWGMHERTPKLRKTEAEYFVPVRIFYSV
jgi:hypothetical protein